VGQRIVTREELHRLVWTRRMGDVADDLKVSANELAVLIETLDVPFPFSGYWARTSPSDAKPPRLRRAKPDTPESVEITTVPASEPKRGPRPPEPAEPVPDIVDASEGRRPTSAPRLVRPHRYIAARLEESRRNEARWRALGVGGRSQREDETTRRRRIIEDLIFKEVERRGHVVKAENGALHDIRFVIDGQTITYGIRERYTQRRQALPKEELNEPSNVALGRTHTQVRLMTGELVFAADSRFIWPKREWRDMAHLPLEQQVAQIVEGLEKLAVDVAARAAERAAEEARYREEQARRDEIRRQQLRNANQWQRFRELAVRSEEAVAVRTFVARLRAEAVTSDRSDELSQWLAWAEQKLAEWDPCTRGINAVMRDVQSRTEHDSGG
jgi:hypothetical protein